MSVTRTTSPAARRPSARRLLTITPFVIIALGATVLGAMARVPDGQIAPGVHVGDLDLGGKSLEEARAALEQWATRRQATPITLKFAPETHIQRAWKPEAQKLGLGFNVPAILDAAGKAGHEGFVGQISHLVSGRPVIQIPPQTAIDDAKLNAYLKNQIAHDVLRKAKKAQFVILPGGGFGTHREQPGVALDASASAAAVKQAWNSYSSSGSASSPAAAPADPPASTDQDPAGQSGSSSQEKQDEKQAVSAVTSPAAPEAFLVAKIVQPEITSEDLKQIDGVLGSQTSYVKGTPSRLNNITIAASHINGTLLRPGEVFSYNKIVGPRDEDSGYREAPILIKGKHDKGIAGGICQTSGTLFNAVLWSGLKVVHRENHSTPIGYLKTGLDATVSYGSIDFQFQNDTPAPVYLTAGVHGRNLTFTLYGKRNPDRSISLVRGSQSSQSAGAEIHKDSSKPAGYRKVVEKGANGYRVTWYRVIKEGGSEIRRDSISSHYRPVPSVVVVGTGAPKLTAPPAPANGVKSASPTPPVTPGSGSPAPPTGVTISPGH